MASPTKRLRLLRGWLCYQAVMLMPVRMDSPVYSWALAWAGWYAHGADDAGVQENGNGR